MDLVGWDERARANPRRLHRLRGSPVSAISISSARRAARRQRGDPAEHAPVPDRRRSVISRRFTSRPAKPDRPAVSGPVRDPARHDAQATLTVAAGVLRPGAEVWCRCRASARQAIRTIRAGRGVSAARGHGHGDRRGRHQPRRHAGQSTTRRGRLRHRGGAGWDAGAAAAARARPYLLKLGPGCAPRCRRSATGSTSTRRTASADSPRPQRDRSGSHPAQAPLRSTPTPERARLEASS